jgi:hypothetical protein
MSHEPTYSTLIRCRQRQAFAAIWNILRADDPFRDYVNDAELRISIGHKLMELVANGETNPVRLGYLTLKSLPRH